MKLKGISDQGIRRIAKTLNEDECPCKKMLKDEFDIDMDKFEDEISGGKGDKAIPSDFPLEQIKKGIKVEMEHTDDPYRALEIVMDHLTEFENYYTGLKVMEDKLKED